MTPRIPENMIQRFLTSVSWPVRAFVWDFRRWRFERALDRVWTRSRTWWSIQP